MATGLQIEQFDYPLNDQQRNQRLYRGTLLVFRQLPSLLALRDELHQLICTQLETDNPQSYFDAGSTSCNNSRITRLQESIRVDTQVRKKFLQALIESGLNSPMNFADQLHLRAVGPDISKGGRDRGSLRHHRDTWGSNIQAQINWWTPLYPLQQENTIAFYPHYWNNPVANTSDKWSFAEFQKQRAITPRDQPLDYPYAPQASEEISDRFACPVIINPGDLLCFASAHLHGSTLNRTPNTRFNLEMRTVNISDLESPALPQNQDNAGIEPMYRWFRRISDHQRLDDALAASGI